MHYVTSFVHTQYPLLINFIVLLALGWLHFTILKAINLISQKACLKEKEDFSHFKSFCQKLFISASLMAWSFA